MEQLNFTAQQSLEDLEFQQDVYTEEFLERMKLVFGSSYDTAQWGIVDEEDPTAAQTSDTRPLIVRVNSTITSTIDVLAGIAVDSTGERIVLTAPQEQIALADGASGAVNVVYLRYATEGTETVINRYNEWIPQRYEVVAETSLLNVATLSDWTALSSVEREHDVVLAVVKVQSTTTGNELVVDMTQDSYAWNRPWFSPVDIQHRSLVGTGTVTTNNPHGLQLNDLVTNGFTLWQLTMEHGMIVSKDIDYAKLPGTKCEEIIVSAAIQTDSTGTVTGTAGSKYCTLQYFPTRLVRVTDNDTSQDDLAAEILWGTRIIAFDPLEEHAGGDALGTKDLKVTFTWTQAGHPVIATPQTEITLSNPDTSEAIIAGGLQVTELSSASCGFADAGGFPLIYDVFIDSSENARKRPQVVFCTTRLEDVGTTQQPFVITPWGPGYIRVGLAGASAGASLDVELKVWGTDSTGATISETFNFGASWVDNPPGSCSQSEDQFVVGTLVFYSLTYWEVVNRQNDGAGSTVMFWLVQSPVLTTGLADIAPIAEATWDGLQVCRLIDKRPINTVATKPTMSDIEPAMLGPLLLTQTAIVSTPIEHKLTIPGAGGFFVSGGGNDYLDGEYPATDTDRHLNIDFAAVPTTARYCMSDKIPDGAIVTRVKIYYNITGASDVEFTLHKATLTGSVTQLFSWVTVTGPGTPTLDLGALSLTIDKTDDTAYWITARHAGSNAELHQAVVTYTVNEDVVQSAGLTPSKTFHEDFRKPYLFTDQYYDTALTDAYLSKDSDGLDPRDFYVSRPISLESATHHVIRAFLFGVRGIRANNLTVQLRYYQNATNQWGSWTSPLPPEWTWTISDSDLTKIQFRVNPQMESSAAFIEAAGIGFIHFVPV